MSHEDDIRLARISARGVVQGVGFRPFVYSLAKKHGLRGWVCNTSEDVRIEVEGKQQDLDLFIYELEHDAPPLARIESVSAQFDAPAGYSGFEIRHSQSQPGKYQLVSPDIATCRLCLDDIFNRGNRRYRYPFTNCTNCGPRFTIIKDIPYDRPLTTMSEFKMCADCRREYEDPLDRRFHAQPNACPLCGPRLELTDSRGVTIGCDDIIRQAASFLRDGKVVAIKGLGGFLLACDARNSEAVTTLRRRKHRPSKPFAVMLQDVDEVRKHCTVSRAEEELLTSPQGPIVLLRWRPDSSICQECAPALKHLGVMLPYTPLHHLLVREAGMPLVMTSGNISEEPIAGQNSEALRRLGGIADYFLMHNREIYSTYDDSVTAVIDDGLSIIRRARGYAPYPIHLNFQATPVLACGAEEKNTFCLTHDNHAFVSQHIGDMENLDTLQHYERTLELYERLFRIRPEIIAYDMHPDYLPTKFALELAGKEGLKAVAVQHHHAHIASCLADNEEEGPVIGVSFDGTGYGTDGHIWGSEVIVADFKSFRRIAHLEYLPLPGGSLAIKKPYRTALGYVMALSGQSGLPPLVNFIDNMEIELIRKQVEAGINTPLTSSMGRLFDAVSALCGICTEINYEAQAAVELEARAYEAPAEKGAYPFVVEGDGDCQRIKVGKLIAGVISDLEAGCAVPVIAMKFHNTVAAMAGDACLRVQADMGIGTVALSGGCFQNRLLLSKTVRLLRSSGFRVLTHRQVPANDGGISLGQAVIAARA